MMVGWHGATAKEKATMGDENAIRVEDVVRAYRGRTGCMCGCRGRYFDEGRGLKGVLKDVNANLATAIRHEGLDGEQIVAVEQGERTVVLYVRGTADLSFITEEK